MIRLIPFEDSYYKDVVNLIYDNRDILGDDYRRYDTLPNIMHELELIKDNVYIGLDDDKFFCFLVFFDISGNSKINHSCFIAGASKRKVNPLKTREAFQKFIDKLYYNHEFVKICAKTHKDNKAAIRIIQDLGFKREGWLKGDTLKNSKLQDFLLFGKINQRYLKNIRKV